MCNDVFTDIKYSALTPGQKCYLCSVCEVYSEAHMRKLMQQHYLNVLHRSIGAELYIHYITPGFYHKTLAYVNEKPLPLHKTKASWIPVQRASAIGRDSGLYSRRE
ncbi:hypothetical protein QTP86_002525 [Hemibagrus guttatus]|nr:hypothetical protein QTP86_002525 [Hemibagrus guttatus]